MLSLISHLMHICSFNMWADWGSGRCGGTTSTLPGASLMAHSGQCSNHSIIAFLSWRHGHNHPEEVGDRTLGEKIGQELPTAFRHGEEMINSDEVSKRRE